MKIARRVENKQVLVDLAPSVMRGFVMKEGKQGEPVGMRASHGCIRLEKDGSIEEVKLLTEIRDELKKRG